MVYFGRTNDWHQGAAMSAKPDLRRPNGLDGFEEPSKEPAQDVFVSDDPALAIWKNGRKREPAKTAGKTVNEDVSRNLKPEKLAYIMEMLQELRKLSNTVEEPMIAYLIEMAILETNTAINVREFDLEMGSRGKAPF